MQLAPSLDHIVLFSGDGDFRSLVAALQQMGKRVSVVSTLQTQPPMVADELRRQADQFVDLAELENEVARALPERERVR
jgi:NYN domain-containing protein